MSKMRMILVVGLFVLLGAPEFARATSLTVGSRGSAVQQFQTQLVTLGYLTSDNATGYYGNVTKAAVRKFQKEHGLAETNPNTEILVQLFAKLKELQAKLAELLNKESAVTAPSAPLSTSTPSITVSPIVTTVSPTTTTVPPSSSPGASGSGGGAGGVSGGGSGGGSSAPTTTPATTTPLAGNWSPSTLVYSPNQNYTKKRYAIDPTVVRIGSVDHLFTCENAADGTFTDEIHYTQLDANTGATLIPDTSILTASPTDKMLWDSALVCDPSVIALETHYGGQDYHYALFYNGTAVTASADMQIGVAFAKDIAGPWVRYPYPVVSVPGVVAMQSDNMHVQRNTYQSSDAWGAAAPTVTAASAHRFLITYLAEDKGFWREEIKDITMDNLDTTQPLVSAPRVFSVMNQSQVVGTQWVSSFVNLDMVYDPASDHMIFANDYFSKIDNKAEPSWIADSLQVGAIPGSYIWSGLTAPWQPLAFLNKSNDGPSVGFDRHFEGGFVRNMFGFLPDSSRLELYWNSSCVFNAEGSSASTQLCPASLDKSNPVTSTFSTEIWKTSLPISLQK